MVMNLLLQIVKMVTDEADKHIVDADIVISQPFFPYYLTKENS